MKEDKWQIHKTIKTTDMGTIMDERITIKDANPDNIVGYEDGVIKNDSGIKVKKIIGHTPHYTDFARCLDKEINRKKPCISGFLKTCGQ